MAGPEGVHLEDALASTARAVPPFPDVAEQEDATGCESIGENECVKRIPGWRPPRERAFLVRAACISLRVPRECFACRNERTLHGRGRSVRVSPIGHSLLEVPESKTAMARCRQFPLGVPASAQAGTAPNGCLYARYRTNIGAVPRHENSPGHREGGVRGSGGRKSPQPSRQCSITSFPSPRSVHRYSFVASAPAVSSGGRHRARRTRIPF
ncbi:hypothetical protein ACVWZ8_005022 [Arthrobacter sp. UYCu723]